MKSKLSKLILGSVMLMALACAIAGWVHPASGLGALAALVLFGKGAGVSLAFAALVAGVDVPERASDTVQYPVAAATHIVPGVFAALDANGNAVQGDDVAGLKVIGRSEDDADNSLGLAGAIACNVKRGVFAYANSVANPIPATAVGTVAYVEAPDTVATTSTNKVAAGIAIAVDENGVWVDTRVAPLIATGLITVPAQS